MNSVMRQLALAVGVVMFCLSMLMSLTGGVSCVEAIFRGVMVMLLATAAAALFFRCFVGILYASIVRRLDEQRKAQELARSQKREA
jgi:hypothetical protein